MEKYTNEKDNDIKYPVLLIRSLKLNSLLEKLKIMFKLTEVSDKQPSSEGYVKYMNIMISNGKYALELGVGEVNEDIILFLDEQQIDYTYYEAKGKVGKLTVKDFLNPKTLNPKICADENIDEDIDPKEENITLEDLVLDDLFETEEEQSPIQELIPKDMDWR